MELARYIDHTLLKPGASPADIRALCAAAVRCGFYSVCIPPCYVPLAAQELCGTTVAVCTVCGFPLGANAPQVKAFEARLAVEQGAGEVDMVINIGRAKAGDWKYVEEEIRAVTEAARPALVKVIIEACLLTDEEKRLACRAAMAAGAGFVKTSTGFSTGGATLSDVRLMRETVGSALGVKAAGGIRDRAAALAMIQAGASRIGTSAGEAILTEA